VVTAAAIVERVGQELRAHGAWDAYFEGRKTAYRDDLIRLQRVHARSPLLEVGAFPFHFSRCLTLAGYDFRYVDLNPNRATPLLSAFGLIGVRCDVEREPLPFADGGFQTVLLNETFEHLRIDPLFALSQIARVLSPGGLLYLTTPNFYRVGNVLRFLLGRGLSNDPLHEYGKLASIGHMGHVREYTAHEMSTVLQHSGFAEIEIDRRVLPSRHGVLMDLTHAALARFRPGLVICARRLYDAPTYKAAEDTAPT
jgi:SAM-dependent methyltransferase